MGKNKRKKQIVQTSVRRGYSIVQQSVGVAILSKRKLRGIGPGGGFRCRDLPGVPSSAPLLPNEACFRTCARVRERSCHSGGVGTILPFGVCGICNLVVK